MTDRTLTPATEAAFDAQHAIWCVLVELDFASGFVRVSDLGQDIEWNGYTWQGIGTLGRIRALEEGTGLASRGVVMELSGVSQANMAIALGQQYQGRPANIYIAALDSTDYSIVDDPVSWSMRMDTMTIDRQNGIIQVTAESPLADWDRRRVRRHNDADQQSEFPGDRGLEFAEQMTDYLLIWGVLSPFRTFPPTRT